MNSRLSRDTLTNFTLRLLDILTGLLLAFITAPLFFIVLMLNLICLGPPIFHVSRRQGKNGRPYRHVKFRSLLPGRATGRIFFEQERLTRYGRLLRALHLDELPELYLILSGRMSLTGPRPLPASLLSGLPTALRQSVRPGWTGPAQLHLLRCGRLDKHLQIRLDEQYVRERSVSRAVHLCLHTLRLALRRAAPDLTPDASEDRRRFGAALEFSPQHPLRSSGPVAGRKPERIAVIDWGIGGLPLFFALKSRYPSLPLVYFSDSGSPPYGKLATNRFLSRLRTITVHLQARDVTRVVAACNTISSVLPLPAIPLPVTGVIDAAVEAVARLQPRVAGLIGTRRTIRSGRYRQCLNAQGIAIRERETQPLAALIERGRGRSPRALRLVRRACRPLHGVDVLILGCTHYAALRDVFHDMLPGVRIVDPAEETALRFTPAVSKLSGETPPPDLMLTTGDPALMAEAARLAFGIHLTNVQRVAL